MATWNSSGLYLPDCGRYTQTLYVSENGSGSITNNKDTTSGTLLGPSCTTISTNSCIISNDSDTASALEEIKQKGVQCNVEYTGKGGVMCIGSMRKSNEGQTVNCQFVFMSGTAMNTPNWNAKALMILLFFTLVDLVGATELITLANVYGEAITLPQSDLAAVGEVLGYKVVNILPTTEEINERVARIVGANQTVGPGMLTASSYANGEWDLGKDATGALNSFFVSDDKLGHEEQSGGKNSSLTKRAYWWSNKCKKYIPWGLRCWSIYLGKKNTIRWTDGNNWDWEAPWRYSRAIWDKCGEQGCGDCSQGSCSAYNNNEISVKISSKRESGNYSRREGLAKAVEEAVVAYRAKKGNEKFQTTIPGGPRGGTRTYLGHRVPGEIFIETWGEVNGAETQLWWFSLEFQPGSENKWGSAFCEAGVGGAGAAAAGALTAALTTGPGNLLAAIASGFAAAAAVVIC